MNFDYEVTRLDCVLETYKAAFNTVFSRIYIEHTKLYCIHILKINKVTSYKIVMTKKIKLQSYSSIPVCKKSFNVL